MQTTLINWYLVFRSDTLAITVLWIHEVMIYLNMCVNIFNKTRNVNTLIIYIIVETFTSWFELRTVVKIYGTETILGCVFAKSGYIVLPDMYNSNTRQCQFKPRDRNLDILWNCLYNIVAVSGQMIMVLSVLITTCK